MKTILGIIVIAVVAIAAGLALTPRTTLEKRTDLPWQIVANDDGTSRVFGLTLSRSTLADAIRKIGEHPEITMFVSPDGKKAVEAYFEQVTLGGVRAKMVVSAALGEKQLEQIYLRGLRISRSSSGNRKVTLHPDDIMVVKGAPIGAITYLPRADLDAETITRLFGAPARRVREPEGEVEHWLYPAMGLDIALSAKSKEVLQYVAPDQFERLSVPIVEAAGE
ncbi:MAG TPA: hypothetical protein ENJ43_02655 [Gammaproteobacteria bacterium]|nr:hypothetical protein [Gammaproteobacteria bacterium]